MLSQIRTQAVHAALALMLLGTAAVALSACNTTEGFGQDVSNTGHAISKSADQNKPQ